MISEINAKRFCKDDISKIENYDKALADTTQIWICHHRLGLTLDGEHAHSAEELQRLDMYYNRPYFELMFVTKSEHDRIHNTGKTLSTETKKKMSETHKGMTHSEDTKKKLSESHKGKMQSDKTRQKIGAACKGRTSPNKGRTWKLIDGKRVYFSKEAERKQHISDVMHREWNDPEKRESRLKAMNEAADRRRIHTDITAHQLDSDEARRQYMREYQRKYRQLHPDYYRKYYTPKTKNTENNT